VALNVSSWYGVRSISFETEYVNGRSGGAVPRLVAVEGQVDADGR
jgi:hypothetical protein